MNASVGRMGWFCFRERVRSLVIQVSSELRVSMKFLLIEKRQRWFKYNLCLAEMATWGRPNISLEGRYILNNQEEVDRRVLLRKGLSELLF